MDIHSARVNEMVRKDTWYQSLLSESLEYEKKYLQIRNALPEEEQLVLEQYAQLPAARSFRVSGT